MEEKGLSGVAAFCSAVMRIMERMQASCMRIRIMRRRIRMRISVLSYACKNIVASPETLPQKHPIPGMNEWGDPRQKINYVERLW